MRQVYPFRLLIKSVGAVAGRDIMVVKLLLFFFLCVFEFVVVVDFDLVFVLFFLSGWLYVVVFVFCLA